MANILILEPDLTKNRALCKTFKDAGHVCHGALNLQHGAQVLACIPVDLAVMNTRFPWRASQSLLQTMKAHMVPLLFLTDDKENALHLRSVYAYRCEVLSTPFSAKKLLSCAKTLMENLSEKIQFGALSLETGSNSAKLYGVPLSLTQQEYALLHALISSPGRVVTRDELLRTAWGFEGKAMTRTVDVHIQRLRRKLGKSAIETVYRTGYLLTTEFAPESVRFATSTKYGSAYPQSLSALQTV